MPKRYGVKEKDQVVSHIINLVLTGKLRSGDRVDRNEIAHELGLSRVPIQEAVVQLEHDGIPVHPIPPRRVRRALRRVRRAGTPRACTGSSSA